MGRSYIRQRAKMLGWAPLSLGDTVDLIAPGFAPTRNEIKGAVAFLRSWGLNPRVPSGLIGPDPLFANTDDQRFLFLKRALQAPDSKAIWCLRGGYGAIRLLPSLQKLKRPRQSKLLIGYSDVTTLHLFLNQVWGWSSLHGPLLDRFGQGVGRPRDKSEMKAVLFGTKTELTFDELRPLNSRARQSGRLRAPITGGNLTTWASSMGTPWQGSARGKILLFEDIGEQGRRVDRMLVQMAQAGHFQGVRAVIFGEFLGGAQPDGRYLWRDVIRSFAAEMPCPVFDHFPSGHGKAQRPVPFGPRAELKLGRAPQLVIASGISR
ncbi:MAG: LD-carboxypeptidase [Bdellovibrionales bacterium]|nr:LD-carboxypeptidase [Bdellovibrionales bacterium]